MLRSLLVCAILAIGTIAGFRSRFAALLLYLWIGFFRPQEWVWFDLTALHVSLIVGVLVVVPSLLEGILPNVTHPLSLGGLAFLAVTLVSQISAVRPDIGWQWIDYMARLLTIVLLMVSIVRSKKELTLTVAIVAGSLGFHTAKAGLASVLGGGVRYAEGLAGPWIDNNGYALAGTMVIFPLLVLGRNCEQKSVRWLCYLAAFLTVATVLSTFSREAFLGLVAGTVVYVCLQRRRLVTLASLALAVVLFLAVVPLPAGYSERLDSILKYEEIGDTSALSRLHFWRVAVDMSLDNPFGVGLRNFESAFDNYDFLDGAYGQHRSVHSSHLQVLAETGIPGFCIWIYLITAFFAIGLRIRARARQLSCAADRFFCMTMSSGLMASMAAFVVGGAFIALALNDLTWVSFGLMAALDRVSRDMAVQTPAAEATVRIHQRHHELYASAAT